MYIILAIAITVVLIGLGALLVVTIIRSNKKRKQQVIWDKGGIVTSSGLTFYPSPKMLELSKETMDKWVEEVVQFWYAKKGWDKDKSRSFIRHVKIFMYDKDYLVRTIAGKNVEVNGITYPDRMVIELATTWKDSANGKPIDKVYLVVRHELSHIIAGVHEPTLYWDMNASHKLFAESGLGA